MNLGPAWAAGLFEGEGSISLTPWKGRANCWRYQLSLSSSDEDVVREFSRSVMAGTVKGPYANLSPLSKKPRWTWSISTRRGCLEVCERLLPYLGKRRSRAARRMIKHLRMPSPKRGRPANAHRA